MPTPMPNWSLFLINAFVLALVASKQEVQGFAHSCPKFYSANVNPINKLRVLSAYTNEEPTSTRSSFLQNGIHRVQLITSLLAGTFALLGPRLIARADETASPALSTPTAPAVTTVEPVPLGPPPTDFGLIENDYYGDAQKVVTHMRYACQLPKESPILTDFAGKTKKEMVDFVSFYRRFQGISGKQSFSLLYTSINVLAGHYSSYGLRVAVPEKRRRRLLQELNDIERNINRRR